MLHTELVSALESRTEGVKLGKALKKEYSVCGIPGLQITRWKFNEWDYYNEKAQLPIEARGLFTLGERILLRGYNKFFNIGETKATKFENLQAQTSGPYFATVKENGFLVLITGYNSQLVVTSKNSSGTESTNEAGRNYAEVAREWVLKHLQSVGQTEAALAQFLEVNDLTAVGEMCDDNFEEHVLPYPDTLAGIYLNGLNHNTCEFSTEEPARVTEIARQFGFRETDFVKFDDFEALMAFLEGGAKTGKWQDREVEGFVIRCKRQPVSKNKREGDFFFKFKFEEPYMMYREWREIVKAYLIGGNASAYARCKRSRHSESGFKFLHFAQFYLGEHPRMRDKLLNHNQGIIELRSQFFAAPDISEEMLLKMDDQRPKWVLVTVATLGCGKTTTAKALTYLLNGQWGHEQSDAITGKGGKMARLVHAVGDSLADHDVVILDRNNSRKAERKQIFELVDELSLAMGYDMQYVCLNFLPEGSSKRAQTLTRQRVMARGDGHQTLRVSELGEKGVSGIMAQFERNFDIVNRQAEPDSHFDKIIDLKLGDSTANVKIVLESLRNTHKKLDIPDFSDEQIEAAVQHIRELERSAGQPKAAPKLNKLRKGYFAIAIDEHNSAQIAHLAQQTIQAYKDTQPPPANDLQVKTEFHVTLAHNASNPSEFLKLRQQHAHQIKSAGKTSLGTKHTFWVTEVRYNTRVMAFKISGLDNDDKHITAALAPQANGVEANTLFDGSAEDVHIIKLETPLHFQKQEMYVYLYS